MHFFRGESFSKHEIYGAHFFRFLTIIQNLFFPIDKNEKGQTYFALAMGCSVGCVWWYLHHKYFVELYWTLVPQAKANGFDSPNFDVLYAAIDIVTVVCQSVMVGFAAALFAPRRPYALALTAMFLTFLCKIPQTFTYSNWLFMSRGSPHAPQPAWVVWLCCFFYIQGPLAGAFVAQVLKPMRQVHSAQEPQGARPNLRFKFRSWFSPRAHLWEDAIGVTFMVGLFWHLLLVFFIVAPPVNRHWFEIFFSGVF